MVSIAIDRTDGLSSATAIKGPVKVATTANIALTGLQTIDGVSLATGDRVLVKDQTTASQNGIYVVDTGPWRRAKDFSGNRDVKTGTQVYVTHGALYAATGWYVSTVSDPIVIGEGVIGFQQNAYLNAAQLNALKAAAEAASNAATAAAVRAETAAAGVEYPVSYGALQALTIPEKNQVLDNVGLGRRPIVVLAAGQSNIEESRALAWAPPPNLFLWNADYTTPGTVAVAMPATSMRVSYSFAAEIAKANPTRPVYVVNIGKGAEPIVRWMVGAGGGTDMYAATKAAVQACLAAIGVSQIDHFLWWQGESDQMAGSLTYVYDWQTVWLRFASESWFPRTTPITIMAVSEFYVPDPTGFKAFNNILRRIVDIEPQYRTFVDTSSLDIGAWEDPAARIHMTGAGYMMAGQMAYQAMNRAASQRRVSSPWQTRFKRRTEARRSVVVPAADPYLQFPMRLNFDYQIRGSITGMAPVASGFRWALSGPTALVSGVVKTIKNETASTQAVQMFYAVYPSGQDMTVTTASVFKLDFDITLSNVSTDGLFRFLWAQRASVAEDTSVFAGSYLEFIEAG